MARLLPPLILALVAVCAACRSAPPPIIEPTDRAATQILGPNDVVEVRVFGEPELSGDHEVSTDGMIRMPLIGDVQISALSPEQAQSRIEEAYNAAYLKNAQVTILVKKYNSHRVYVLGSVAKPGTYEYIDRMTVIAAIAKAGGVSRLGDANRTVITRQVAGEKQSIDAPISRIQRGNASDIELLPGDIVFVPESYF